MSLIALYFLHSTSVLSFHIDVVLTLSNRVILGPLENIFDDPEVIQWGSQYKILHLR